MRNKILLALAVIVLISGCGGPDPKMDSQDLREKDNKAVQEDTKKVDDKIENVAEVEKVPLEPEMVASKDGDVYNKVVITVDGKNLTYKLPIIHFGFDKFTITSEQMAELENFAQKLKDDKLTDKTLTIGGHCDEWGADEYNIALGLKRAKATETALKNLGINSKMVLTSYGESKPICLAHEQKCWKLNRRAEINILP